MKKIILILFCLFVVKANAQIIFANSFGDTSKPAVVFIHGGPGYNAVSFEVAVAKKLSETGYRVITYDQRGSGRSKKEENTKNYTYNKASDDLNSVLKRFKVNKAILIGHSFGGAVATYYAKNYPDKVQGIVLLDAPVSYQQTFKTILKNCENKFLAGDTSQLRYVRNIRLLDTNKLEYSSLCFMLAMNNGLYQPKRQTPDAKSLYNEMKEHKNAMYLNNLTGEPVQGFYLNERYTVLDLCYDLKKVKDSGIPVYGIYGTDDGLFDTAQLDKIKAICGTENFKMIADASHSPFVDQREEFLKTINSFLNKPKLETKKKAVE